MDNIQITSECLKAISSWGKTTYQNVCNGSVSTVPWGSIDWLLTIVLGIVVSVAVGLLVGAIISLLRSF